MKLIRKISLAIASLLALLLVVFFILKHNPKPELFSLERQEISEIEIDKKAHQLVDEMSLEEKVGMMTPTLKSMFKFLLEVLGDGMRYNQHSYQASGNERLHIPTMRFYDGPRGMVSGKATCFPVAMARAASFDTNLEYKVGEVIGKEIRANNGNFFGGVCINLLRNPAGGRAQESYGEDSYLLGQMGCALMKGVQKHNVMACIKHYAVNNQENARFKINMSVDERVLREVYLPHFKECIDNGAASVMGAYNKFRGEQCCESQHLLQTILKENWNFKGFTISDFMYGIRNTEKAANAGLDIEMPCIEDYGDKLLKAVQNGKVAETKIDESAFRVARTILKFETHPDPIPAYPKEFIGNREHIKLALEVAQKSMVLMQNKNATLPFDKTKIKNILVVGQLAKTENIGDHGSSRVIPKYVVTPMEGFQKQYGTEVNFTYSSGENIAELKKQAKAADAVIFVVGYNHSDEGEFIEMGGKAIGGDRASLRLHKNESELLQQVAPLNKKSVAVLIGGSAIIIDEWKDNVNSIIHAFYPGMEGGTAIAQTIFGDVNPSGKLPFSVAKEESHYPAFDRFAEAATYDRYHGYVKLDHDGNKAAFPFGFGLSYTLFNQQNARIETLKNKVTASMEITNTGLVKGDEVIQLYIGFDNSTVEREHKLLKGFKRISLQPGETKTVNISCPFEKMKRYNPNTKLWELEKMEYQAYIGTSSDENDLFQSTFKID